MYILNPTSISNTFKTKSKIVKDYLVKNNIPLLSNQEGFFYFSKTKKLQEALDNLPIHLREEVKNE